MTAIETRISAPPIVGVPALIRCVCGPSSRTDWPILHPRQPRDHPRADDERDHERRHRREHRAQRDVAEHVECADVSRASNSVSHSSISAPLRAAGRSSAATTRSMRMKREPLTSTVMPARRVGGDAMRRAHRPIRNARRRRRTRARASRDSAPTESSRSMPDSRANAPISRVKRRAFVADFAHVAEHEPAWPRLRREHVDRRAHRVGIRVVRVVDHRDVGRVVSVTSRPPTGRNSRGQ